MKRQIVLSFALIFLLFIIGSGIAIVNLMTTTAELRSLIDLHEIEDIRQNLNLSVQRVLGYVHASKEQFADNLNTVIANTQQMELAINQCHTCHHEPDVQAELNHTKAMADEFETHLSYLATTVSEGPWRAKNQKITSQLGDTILAQVQDMVNRAAITLQHRTDKAMHDINRSYTILAVCLLLTLLLTLFIARSLANRITAPIDALVTAVQHITEGNLGYQADIEATAEFAELLRTFNEMSGSLARKSRENKELHQDLEQKIDELTRTQKQLVEMEKMTALGTLAGGIAHDFNNILCGILSNITLLKRGKDKAGDDFAILETVEQAGFRAADLVQQLLTFSRQDVREVQPVALNLHINNVLQLIKNTLSPKITVRLNLAAQLPVIQGDPAKLEQVLLNLCLNAKDAMEEGGTLTLETKPVLLDENFCEVYPEAEPGQYVALIVADTGSGINESVISRIFEPFFTTKPFGKGSGLGLAMVHGIVKGHHGFITVDSKPASGTRFTVYLPVASST